MAFSLAKKLNNPFRGFLDRNTVPICMSLFPLNSLEESFTFYSMATAVTKTISQPKSSSRSNSFSKSQVTGIEL